MTLKVANDDYRRQAAYGGDLRFCSFQPCGDDLARFQLLRAARHVFGVRLDFQAAEDVPGSPSQDHDIKASPAQPI